MAKHKVYKTNPLRKYIILSLFIFLFIGMGYSVLSTSLGIGGSVGVSKYDQTLYGVLEKGAKKGTYARKYTGVHQDSMNASLSNKDIYHWYAPNSTISTQIKDKWNVIFANKCWQILRTTDTGGVKLLYNGEVDNGKCLDTRNTHIGYKSSSIQNLSASYYYGTSYTYDSANNVFSLSGTVTTGNINVGEYTCKSTSSTGTCETLYLVGSTSNGTYYDVILFGTNINKSLIGNISYNNKYNSMAYAGYMYNDVYNYSVKQSYTENMFERGSLYTSYWYAHDVAWGSPTANKYSLVNPYQVSSTDDFLNLIGEYTLKSNNQSSTSTEAYYIVGIYNTSGFYYINLSSGNSLSYYDYSYTYGDSYTDNGNGTYTINNPTTFNRLDWLNVYKTLPKNKYLCKNAVNNTCSELWYEYSFDDYRIHYLKVSNVYNFSEGFTYDDSTGMYTLSGDSISIWDFSDTSNINSLSTHHYTCWSNGNQCNTLSYVYYVSSANSYYINLTGGKGVNDALNDMLYSNNVNSINSTIKAGVDAWYKKELLNYTSMIEDTVFCNDRTQDNQNHGWNPVGGRVNKIFSFINSFYYSSLSCSNTTDMFSVSNLNARLNYPVGLISEPEQNLFSNGSSILFGIGESYWTISPGDYSTSLVSCYHIPEGGGNGYGTVSGNNGVRPVVSLKPGTIFSSGDGSMANPYVVSTN